MKERPILFSAPMVRALLEGRKTQTRRLVKPQPPQPEEVLKRAGIDFGIFTDAHARTTGEYRVSGPVWAVRELMGVENPTWRSPYGAPGDRLWVRETWRVEAAFNDLPPREVPQGAHVWYEATDEWRYSSAGIVRPSLFMMPWMSRITLEVTGVRVERLQDITPADACAEGVFEDGHYATEPPLPYPVASFKTLWDSINAKRAPWASNPWVWAVEFKRVEAMERAA